MVIGISWHISWPCLCIDVCLKPVGCCFKLGFVVSKCFEFFLGRCQQIACRHVDGGTSPAAENCLANTLETVLEIQSIS